VQNCFCYKTLANPITAKFLKASLLTPSVISSKLLLRNRGIYQCNMERRIGMGVSNQKKIYVLGIIGLLYLIMVSFPAAAEVGKMLSLTEEQKSRISKAKSWKIEVHHDYGKAKKFKGIPIEKDCKQILEFSGWQVMSPDATSFDALLKIFVKGTPRGGSYTTGYHYTGAEIKIEASVKVPKKKWALAFSKSSASQSCPFFISGSYKSPESAPFNAVYYKNKEFFSQLFSIIYLTKGIEPLSLAMKYSSLNKKIRANVHYFAGKTGDKRFVIPLIVSIANETGDVKKEGIVALGKLGDPKAIPALCIALLEDKNNSIRATAAEALGQIGDPKVADALRKALLEDKIRNVRLKSAEALDKIGWEPKSSKEKVFYSLAKNKKQEIVKMGKEVVPVLIEILNDSNAEIRQDSAEILGNLKLAEATEPLSKALLEDTSFSVRKKTVVALGKIGDPKAIPALCIALLEDKNSSIRATAAEALGQIGDPKVADALSKALLEDKIKNVRLKSAEALGKIGSKKAIQPLNKRLNSETDKAVKKAISNALLALGAEEKVPIELQIETLKEKKDWKKLRPTLQEQTTDKLIEQLKSKDKIIKGMVAEILMQRTGKFDLGTDYNAWKNWSKKSKKK